MALWRPLTQKEEIQNDTEGADGSSSPLGLTSQSDQRPENEESLIAPDLLIEGKIEGSGDVRIAGRFKGEVSVKGDLTIEQGAHISGEVRAENIVVRGKVEGNLHATSQVQLLEPGVITGDLKASTLTVAAGSCMRGKVEFGWGEVAGEKVVARAGGGSAL
ncbi:MAG: polymer-forming cytoskeletal protein [Acidobacteriota bacterium]